MTCGYEGRHFDANIRMRCADGYLWYLDGDDEQKDPLHRDGEIGCPRCNTMEFLDCHNVRFSGNSHQRRVEMRSRIRDIRKVYLAA